MYKYFIPYYGTKKNEIDYIDKYISINETFVDVFGGSGCISSIIKKNNPNIIVIYNDNNSKIFRLIELFRTKVIYDKIEKWNDIGRSRQKYFDTQEECINNFMNMIETVTNEDLLLIIKCLYSTYCSYIISPNKISFQLHTQHRYDKWGVERRCIQQDYYYESYKDIDEILNLDYKVVLEKYKDDENAFLYLDPPYLPKKVSYGQGFSTEDLDFIIEFMKKCKCKVMLNPDYNDFYKQKIETNKHLVLKEIYDKQYRARGKNKAQHCIITNY